MKYFYLFLVMFYYCSYAQTTLLVDGNQYTKTKTPSTTSSLDAFLTGASRPLIDQERASETCDCIDNKSENSAIKRTKESYNAWDRYGNKYCDLGIVKHDELVASSRGLSANTSGQLFNLIYSSSVLTTIPQSYLDIVAQVFADVGALIVRADPICGATAEPVNIGIVSLFYPDPTRSFFEGSGYYRANPSVNSFFESNSIFHNEIWKAINTGTNEPGLYDGIMIFNPDPGQMNVFSSALDPNAVVPETIDFYSFVLRQVWNMLGMDSMIAADGSGLITGGPLQNGYSVYDAFLQKYGGSNFKSNEYIYL
jgi:hypothetical protein